MASYANWTEVDVPAGLSALTELAQKSSENVGTSLEDFLTKRKEIKTEKAKTASKEAFLDALRNSQSPEEVRNKYLSSIFDRARAGENVDIDEALNLSEKGVAGWQDIMQRQANLKKTGVETKSIEADTAGREAQTEGQLIENRLMPQQAQSEMGLQGAQTAEIRGREARDEDTYREAKNNQSVVDAYNYDLHSFANTPKEDGSMPSIEEVDQKARELRLKRPELSDDLYRNTTYGKQQEAASGLEIEDWKERRKAALEIEKETGIHAGKMDVTTKALNPGFGTPDARPLTGVELEEAEGVYGPTVVVSRQSADGSWENRRVPRSELKGIPKTEAEIRTKVLSPLPDKILRGLGVNKKAGWFSKGENLTTQDLSEAPDNYKRLYNVAEMLLQLNGDPTTIRRMIELGYDASNGDIEETIRVLNEMYQKQAQGRLGAASSGE